jgi:hypothetical protein
MGSPSECFATVLVASASRRGRPPVESGWSSRSSVASPLPLRRQRGKPMACWCVGRWPFPLAPPAFVPHHGAYGVPSQLDMSLVRIAPGRDLPDLCLSFGDATGTVRPLDSFATDSLPARPLGPGAGCAATPASTGLLSWGFPKSAPPPTCPSRVHSRVDPLGRRPALRLETARSRARSALAVPPGFDGLLRATTCRLVASCSRSWGSPHFKARADLFPRLASARGPRCRHRHSPRRSRSRRTARRPWARQPRPSGRLAGVPPRDLGNPSPPAEPGTRVRDAGSGVAADPSRRGVTTSACAQSLPSIVPARTHPLHCRSSEPPRVPRSGSPPDSVPLLVAHHPPEVSPRQQPYRVTAALAFAPSITPAPHRVSAAKKRGRPRPQGLAPLPSPLRGLVLPPDPARSSLGLAYQTEPGLDANRRPVGPPGHTRR